MSLVVVAKSHKPGEWRSARNPNMSYTKAVMLYNNGLGTLAQRKVDRTAGQEKYELVFIKLKRPKKMSDGTIKKPYSWRLYVPLSEKS